MSSQSPVGESTPRPNADSAADEPAAAHPLPPATKPPSTAVRVLQVLLPFVVLAVAVVIVRTLIATKPEPGRREEESLGTLVETVEVHRAAHALVLEAQGQVVPAQRVVVSAEVPGRIRSISEELVPGGQVREGDVLFRVDPREYSLAVQSRAADVGRAQLELQLEERRAEIAEREWQAFGDGEEANSDGRALALRQPQQETAQVSVRAAQNAVQTARLNLHRTTVRAPFNATVLAETVDVGQYVAPGAQLATLAGTDAGWVQIAVPVDALSRIQVRSETHPGSAAQVFHTVGNETIEHEGHVVRLLPDLDPAGSMARILVEVRDPLGLESPGRPPLLFGSFVQVQIEGGSLESVEVPRRALHDGRTIYVMSPDNTLSVRELAIGWRREESVLVTGGVSDGEAVILSRIIAPVDGMPLRTLESASTETETEPAGE